MSSGQVKQAQLKLVKVDGQNWGGTFRNVIHLDKNNVKIGRAPDCNIVWASLQISRHHATLEFLGSQWYIRDTSSTGITLNGDRVRKWKRIHLSHSAVIGFISNGNSSVEYQFQYDQAHSSSRMVPQSETRPVTKKEEIEALQETLGHSKSMNVALREESLKKIQELMASELNCVICNQVFIKATVIGCGHSFCSFCISSWSRTKKICPICRKPFKNMVSNVQTASFISKIYESNMTPELQALRATNITEREEEENKTQKEAQNPNRRNPTRRNPNGRRRGRGNTRRS